MPNSSRVKDIELGLSGPKNRSPKRLRGDKRRAYKRGRNGAYRSSFQGTEDALKGYTYTLAPNRTEVWTKTTREIADYVGRNYKNGGGVKRSIDKLKVVEIPTPPDLPVAVPAVEATDTDFTTVPPTPGTPAIDAIPGPTPTEKRIWEREVDEYMKRKQILARNLENLYPLVWGQCEIGLRNKVRALEEYETFSSMCDSVSLLKAIREIAFSLESQKYPPLQVYDMGRTLFLMKQSHNQSVSDYLERFKDQVDIIDECGG